MSTGFLSHRAIGYTLGMDTDTPGTGRDSDKFMLRLPDGMRDFLKLKAKVNKRTLNAEIVLRLQQSMEIDQATPELMVNDPAVQRIAAEHMYSASVDLLKVDPEFKRQVAEMLAAALVIADGRKAPAEASGTSALSPEPTPSQKKPADN